MSDIRETFPTLEGDNQEGLALRKVQQGEAVAGKNGSLAFGFRDSDGNAVAPQLTEDGKIPVTQDAAGECITGTGSVAGNQSETVVLEIELEAGKLYKQIEVLSACFRDAIWKLVHVDDPEGTPAEVTLAEWLSGPGQYSVPFKQHCLNFQAGSTDPVLRVIGQNLNKESQMRATASLLQVD